MFNEMFVRPAICGALLTATLGEKRRLPARN